jgi:hypothetical protein
VLKGGVGGQDRIVWLNNRRRELWRRVDAELELRLFAIVCAEALEEEGTKTRASSTTERVEHKEALETRAVICQSTDLVHDTVNQLLSDSVVTTSI